jgi:hypothetical protein
VTLPIPVEALEDAGIVMGRRGAGKSNVLMTLFEHELEVGHRSVMIDPKGDRWGIRMDPDGSASRFDIPVFGGEHGDAPLTADMGETLGELVALNDLSCLIDLSLLSLADKQRFMMKFAPTLLERNRQPLTLFLEEVDQFANQDVRYQPAMLVHHIANFSTLGRQRGIVPWVASQRPAKVNATVRSQADTFVGMRVTVSLDRKAYEDWFKGHGREAAARVESEVGALGVGEALVWVGATGFFDKVQFPLASTYDSGRTPKHGETINAVALPKLSNATILELLKPKVEPEIEIVRGPARAGKTALGKELAELAALRAERDEWTIERLAGQQQLDALIAENGTLREIFGRIETAAADARRIRPALDESEITEKPRAIKVASPPIVAKPVRQPSQPPLVGAASNPSPAALAIADLLDRVSPARVSWAQAATMTGRKASGGNFNSARKWLRESGRIVEDGDLIRSAQEAPSGMSREEAIDLWRGVLSNPAPKMIDAFIEHGGITKEELGAAIGAQPRGGNFNNGLAQLRRNGLLYEYGSGTIRLAEPLPGEAT